MRDLLLKMVLEIFLLKEGLLVEHIVPVDYQ